MKSKENKNPAKPKHILIIIGLMVVTFLSLKLLFIIKGHSVDASLGVKISSAFVDYEKGDLFTFNLKHEVFENNNKELLVVKRIACLPKQHLKKVDDTIYCDGVFLGKALLKRQNGTSYPLFTYDGIIPEYHYFLMGDSLDSFDSRYFGFVTENKFNHYIWSIF